MKISLKENYSAKLKDLLGELEVKNVNALPRLTKVTVNTGIGHFRANKEMMTYIQGALKEITGQKPVITLSTKSVSGFKLREGEEVGYKVTLRGQRMHDFLDRLINVSLPRIREFRGFSDKNLDKQGNLTLGFRDTAPFAELGHGSLDKPFGLSVTLTIKNSNKEKSHKLLQALGLPMKSD